MFQKNIHALRFKNPDLAQKLVKMPLPKITVFQNEQGDYNLEYKDTPLHNIQLPLEEAKQLFEPKVLEDNSNNINIIVGLGMGYLFKRAWVSSQSRIVLYEPFLDILRFTLEYVDFSEQISSSNVFICNTLREIEAVMDKK